MKQLWKENYISCSLHAVINGLIKGEMDKIRKNYDLKNLSVLKKPQLASELARLIPLKFKDAIYILDQGRYDFIKTIIRNSGFMSDMGMPVSNAEALMKYSMVFPGIYEDEKVLFIPAELIGIFTQADGSELERVVRRNTEWIRLTHGLLYYDGVMEACLIKEKIEELIGEKIDFLDI